MVSIHKCDPTKINQTGRIPPVSRPPTPTGGTRPPVTANPRASKFSYTPPHLHPGPILTIFLVVSKSILFKFSNENKIPVDVLAEPGSGVWPPLRMANWLLKKFATLTPTAVLWVVSGEKIHGPFSHALVDLLLLLFPCQCCEAVIYSKSFPTNLLIPWLDRCWLPPADKCCQGKAI